MATSSGTKRNKRSDISVICTCLLVCFVTLCQTLSIPKEEIKLTIPHTAELGFTVLQTDLDGTCIEVNHVKQSDTQKSNPFSLTSDGSLVIKSPVLDYVGDIFVINPKTSNRCNKSVSQFRSTQIEIVHAKDSLRFVKSRYEGTLPENARADTKVHGIDHLYACEAQRCSNNLDYRIVGTNDFYLQTISLDGHINLEVYIRNPAHLSRNHIHSFMIIATDSKGLHGYTNVVISVIPQSYDIAVLEDESLHFIPYAGHRHRRAVTRVNLPNRTVAETQNGFLFSVSQNNSLWKYSLASSTYRNAFTVSTTGDVSVATGFRLDYEALTANGGSNAVQLVISVQLVSNGTVVQELQQQVIITDVNDENPVFTNKPTPFLATVSLGAPAGTVVYTLTAADPDAGASLSLAISNVTQPSEDWRNYFDAQISGTIAEIRRIGSRQFTDNQEFRISFIATDNAAPAGTTQRSTAEVQIKAGSRPPQFMETTYVIEFQETNDVDQRITTSPIEVYSFQDSPVTFAVLDENLQTSTIFRAVPTENPAGRIKGCNLRVTKIMDYETPPRVFNVKIRATESSGGLFTDQAVTIRVTDKNEFPPRFSISTYKKENVREDIGLGTSLLTVTATDGDFNTKLTFSVDNDHFRVESDNPDGTTNPYTAVIFVNKKLDFDRINPKNYDFNVIATDNGTISRSGDATVRIFVTNVNDEAPAFPTDMKADLRYDAQVGKEVYIAQATDADNGDQVTYAFVSSYDKFSLEPQTGRITLKSQIAASQETITVFRYELLIRATDNGACCPGISSTPLSSTGTVVVNILTDNQNRPVFTTCQSYNPQVNEEQADLFVIKVNATDEDYGANGKVTYSIRETDSKFRINSTTGDIYTAAKIDREALVESSGSSVVTVNVIATDGGNLQGYCSLRVQILDINDNDPTFVAGSYDFSVINTANIGTVAATVEAKDKDSGKNAEVTYSIAPGSNTDGYFRFDSQSFTGQIKVNKTLPQTATVIMLVVIAQDAGTPPRNSNVTVTMRVISDPNLQPPLWLGTDADFTVSVNESVPVGSNLLTFRAQSRAQTSNVLSFKIVDNGSIFVTKSDLSPDVIKMGYVQHIKPLDYETTQSYSFTLRASDVNNKYSDKRVTITVTDTNDNEPDFYGKDSVTNFLDLSLLEGNYTGAAGNGKDVDQIRAFDSDRTSPNNQIVSYRIEDTNSPFTIDSTTGWLYTKQAFDREDPRGYFYTLSVIAIDGAPSALRTDGQPNTGRVIVKVTIKDVNDNPPTFPQTSYTVFAPEDLFIGARIPNRTQPDSYYRIQAYDPDSDAVLTYSVRPLTGQSSVSFNIQPQTGFLTVAGLLDFDAGPSFQMYTFIVNVDDTKFSNSATVTVTVTDVNDNSPVVGNYNFDNFTENDPNVVGVIATINATDKDNGGNNEFYYELKFTDTAVDAQYFSIGKRNGQLSIVKPLDRDFPKGKAEFIFTVEVADGDPSSPTNPPRYGFGEVTVRPKDVNDNPPIFPEDSRGMTVMENQSNGTRVGRVVVVDYDDGVNAQFDLIIIQQTPAPIVRLREPDRIELETTTMLDREVQETYLIVVQATDRGNPRLTGTGTLTITVGDQNDNPPKFNVTTYKFVLSESQKTGEVGRIQAYDKDKGNNAELTYSLANEDTTYFKMDQDRTLNQGVLKIFQAVDFDDINNSQRSFNLTAYAVDPNPGQNNENRAETKIEIQVTDYNDEVPTFVEREKTATVSEAAPVGTTLATFSANDRDVNPAFGTFEYYIQQKSDTLNNFAINQRGEVSIKHQLDREKIARHIIYILAIDNINGSPQNTGTATLTVTVTDVNDNYPNFAKVYTPQLMENEQYNNAPLLDFSAVDADEPKNGPPFSFELDCTQPEASSQCKDKFTLSMNNDGDNKNGIGQIRVTGIFDREFVNSAGQVEKYVTLPIKMCDLRDKPQQSRQCGIRLLDVAIVDKNDNVHEDGYQFIQVYNYKGQFGNIEIGTVNANDPDDSDTDKQFTLMNPNVAGHFVSIDPVTGKITLKSGVPELSFEVQVRVQDQTNRVKTSTVRISVVFVTDDAVYNSGSIRIDGISPEDFLTKPKKSGGASDFGTSMMEEFRAKLAEKLYGSSNPANLENVLILSVMGNSSQTDVRYAAHGSPWYQSSRMDGIVTANKKEFQDFLSTPGVKNKGTINMVPIDMCKFEFCEGGGCYNKLVVTDTPKLVNTKGASYVGVDTRVEGTCGCRAREFPSTISCTPGYCYHGGECVKDDWGVVSCKCPAGFDGPRCQTLRQSFDGTGYALYRPLEQCEDSRTSIEFMTTKATQLILYNGPVADLAQTDPTDFLLLELSNGHPRMRINHGTGEIALELPNSKTLNDGAWHRIDIFRQKKNVRMVVDHCVSSTKADRSDCEASGVTRGENFYINVISVLQLGGRMSTPSYPANVLTEKFNGCMKNLVHNAEIYDLTSGGQFPGAKDGCPKEDDACASECGNGQCIVTGVGATGILQATCKCDSGFRKSTKDTCDTVTTVRDLQTQSFMDWRMKTTFKSLLNSRQTEISFLFRTRDADGLMFHVIDESNSNKYISLKIVSSRLQLAYNLGQDGYTLLLSNVPKVNDGQWHTVTLERYGKEFILKLDSGEGRYYADTEGPVNGNVDFNVRQDRIYAGASVTYSSGSGAFNGEDFQNSCMNDIRYDKGWFPMVDSEEGHSPAAELQMSVNTAADCIRNDCVNKCFDPMVCLPLWGDFLCVCKEHYIKSGDTCIPKDYCGDDTPCFGDATCSNNIPPGPGEMPYICSCTGDWYGPLCQCHPDLNPSGVACERETKQEETVAFAGGAIAGIIIGILFLIVVVVIVIWLLFCRTKASDKEPFDEDMDDDIRENIMYYDEEGAGEEDHTQYDLTRLRKPDDGEHPSNWDAPDIRKTTKPLGSSADRPEVGDFINDRLNDADDDPNSPPFDTPHDFNYEGGSSDAGSLSSLNTSSSGSQDYDYLNEWGPKFAKLADMYNNYDDTE